MRWTSIFIAGEVVYLPKNASLPITLKSREYEVFTVVPVKTLGNGVKFAPIGLINMFNSGGAIKDLKYEREGDASVGLKVRGSGTLGVYSSSRPKRITVDTEEMKLEYEEGCGLTTIDLRTPEEEMYLWNVSIEV